MAHGLCLYEKKFYLSKALFSLNSTMRPKVQFTPFDVDYQQEERAKTQGQLDELKKPKVIPREKPPASFSFKPGIFYLPP